MKRLLDLNKPSFLRTIKMSYEMGAAITNHTLNHEVVTKLMNSNDHFDLIICEVYSNEAMLGFGHHFKAPVIGVSAFGASRWTNDMVGTPSPLSYTPHPIFDFNDYMTFTQRCSNVLMSFFSILIHNFFYTRQVEIYGKVFSNPKPSLDTLKRNVALVLLNTHFSISYPRPYVPNMIEVGGMHIKRSPSPLPEVNDLHTYVTIIHEILFYY